MNQIRPSSQNTEASLNTGELAPYFSLQGTDGKIYSLSDFRSAKVLAVIFTCNQCPVSQAYEARICRIARELIPLGVAFVAICSNPAEDFPEDSYENMVQKSKELGFPFPYLHDNAQHAARAYGAVCTPECYVFGADLKLQYRGRIDDNYHDEALVEEHSLRDAILSILEGATPTNPTTPVFGCSIKWR